MHKQSQEGCQIGETKKYGPNKRTEQNPRKRTKQNVDNQPIRHTVQNTGGQAAQRTHWAWQQLKGRNEVYTK